MLVIVLVTDYGLWIVMVLGSHQTSNLLSQSLSDGLIRVSLGPDLYYLALSMTRVLAG
jgi:hypothetical protein